MSRVKKGRLWATVCYPESLPENWLEILRLTGLPIAISPLHDKDVNPDGEIKKAHYHVIFVYDGPTTYNHVLDLCNEINAVHPIKLESLRGMYRYHTHMDNPEKYQYDDKDRILLNGFDLGEDTKLTHSEVLKIKKEICNFIEDNDIVEYRTLIKILNCDEYIHLFDVASSNTTFFNAYLISKRNSKKL